MRGADGVSEVRAWVTSVYPGGCRRFRAARSGRIGCRSGGADCPSGDDWPGGDDWPDGVGWLGWAPRRAEARAARADRVAAKTNTTIRPCWNGPEIRLGKNSRPVRVC